MWLSRLLVPAFAVFLASGVLTGAEVGVYLEFDHPPSRPVADAMRKHAAEALSQLGYSVAWRLVAENQGNEAFENLVVVKLTGKCTCQGLLHPTHDILVLGTTAVLDGRVLPYSEVRCDSVRRVLPEAEFDADRHRGEMAFGTALGSVLAHELYHVLMGTTRHAASGIAKAVQSTDELKSSDFSFEDPDITSRRAGSLR